MRKRIAVVANTTWNIHNFRLNILRKLLDEGHEVIVMAPVDKYISYTEKFRDVRHVPIHRMRRNSTNPIHDILLTTELLGLYRRYKPDYIIHYTVKCNIYGGFAARVLGIPSAAVVTGIGHPMIHKGWLHNVVSWLYRKTLPGQECVIFENKDNKKTFDDAGITLPNRSVSIKGCGVDLQYFTPVEASVIKDHLTFTFVGRVIYDKGVREFIEAAHVVKKKYPGTQFWLVGDIDEGNPSSVSNEDLMYWIRDPDIHYHGSTDHVRAFYTDSDCIVLPTYDGEGLPKVIMEAMAMARPVITTSTPGCKEAVNDGVNGYLVPVKDVPALSEAMIRFLDLSPESRTRLGQAGRAMAVKEFDDNDIAAQFYHYLKLKQ